MFSTTIPKQQISLPKLDSLSSTDNNIEIFLNSFAKVLRTENIEYKKILIDEFYELLKSLPKNTADSYSKDNIEKKLKTINIYCNINEEVFSKILKPENLVKIKSSVIKSNIFSIINSYYADTELDKKQEKTKKLTNSLLASFKQQKILNKHAVSYSNSVFSKLTKINIQHTTTSKQYKDDIDSISENIDNNASRTSIFSIFSIFNFALSGTKFVFSGAYTIGKALFSGTAFALNFATNTILKTISLGIGAIFKGASLIGKFITFLIKPPGILILSFIGGYIYGKIKSILDEDNKTDKKNSIATAIEKLANIDIVKSIKNQFNIITDKIKTGLIDKFAILSDKNTNTKLLSNIEAITKCINDNIKNSTEPLANRIDTPLENLQDIIDSYNDIVNTLTSPNAYQTIGLGIVGALAGYLLPFPFNVGIASATTVASMMIASNKIIKTDENMSIAEQAGFTPYITDTGTEKSEILTEFNTSGGRSDAPLVTQLFNPSEIYSYEKITSPDFVFNDINFRKGVVWKGFSLDLKNLPLKYTTSKKILPTVDNYFIFRDKYKDKIQNQNNIEEKTNIDKSNHGDQVSLRLYIDNLTISDEEEKLKNIFRYVLRYYNLIGKQLFIITSIDTSKVEHEVTILDGNQIEANVSEIPAAFTGNESMEQALLDHFNSKLVPVGRKSYIKSPSYQISNYTLASKFSDISFDELTKDNDNEIIKKLNKACFDASFQSLIKLESKFSFTLLTIIENTIDNTIEEAKNIQQHVIYNNYKTIIDYLFAAKCPSTIENLFINAINELDSLVNGTIIASLHSTMLNIKISTIKFLLRTVLHMAHMNYRKEVKKLKTLLSNKVSDDDLIKSQAKKDYIITTLATKLPECIILSLTRAIDSIKKQDNKFKKQLNEWKINESQINQINENQIDYLGIIAGSLIFSQVQALINEYEKQSNRSLIPVLKSEKEQYLYHLFDFIYIKYLGSYCRVKTSFEFSKIDTVYIDVVIPIEYFSKFLIFGDATTQYKSLNDSKNLCFSNKKSNYASEYNNTNISNRLKIIELMCKDILNNLNIAKRFPNKKVCLSINLIEAINLYNVRTDDYIINLYNITNSKNINTIINNETTICNKSVLETVIDSPLIYKHAARYITDVYKNIFNDIILLAVIIGLSSIKFSIYSQSDADEVCTILSNMLTAKKFTDNLSCLNNTDYSVIKHFGYFFDMLLRYNAINFPPDFIIAYVSELKLLYEKCLSHKKFTLQNAANFWQDLQSDTIIINGFNKDGNTKPNAITLTTEPVATVNKWINSSNSWFTINDKKITIRSFDDIYIRSYYEFGHLFLPMLFLFSLTNKLSSCNTKESMIGVLDKYNLKSNILNNIINNVKNFDANLNHYKQINGIDTQYSNVQNININDSLNSNLDILASIFDNNSKYNDISSAINNIKSSLYKYLKTVSETDTIMHNFRLNYANNISPVINGALRLKWGVVLDKILERQSDDIMTATTYEAFFNELNTKTQKITVSNGEKTIKLDNTGEKTEESTFLQNIPTIPLDPLHTFSTINISYTPTTTKQISVSLNNERTEGQYFPNN